MLIMALTDHHRAKGEARSDPYLVRYHGAYAPASAGRAHIVGAAG